MVCEMTISARGRLSTAKFYEAVMSSHARLTYNKVWHILQGDQSCASTTIRWSSTGRAARDV